MYSAIRLSVKYVKYYLTAHNAKGHGVHSPFVFDFIQHVLNDDRTFYAYQSIENLQKMLMYDTRIQSLDKPDAEDGDHQTDQMSNPAIVKSSLMPLKYRQLLFRIIDHYAPEYLLELGTSLGMTSAYLAMANPSSTLTTLDDFSRIVTLAKENFQKLGIKNIRVIEGNIDRTLSGWLESKPKIDFAFIAGGYGYSSTHHYFTQILSNTHEYSILVFNHIHRSNEMEKAWDEIKLHPSVTLSIDLFSIGLIFFRKEFKVKQHLAIRF